MSDHLLFTPSLLGFFGYCDTCGKTITTQFAWRLRRFEKHHAERCAARGEVAE